MRLPRTPVLVCAVIAGALGFPADATSDSGNAASRVVFWTGCDEVAALTDAELDEWRARGAGGFACLATQLRGMGGTQDFTGAPAANLSGANYELQRRLRDSRIAQRAKARDMKLYLGIYLVNYWNTSTPLADWFDESGWSNLALPKMRDLAGAASQLGFAGLAFDQELYPQHDGTASATWDWDYPGNTRSEQVVRAKARQRGRQLMAAMVDAFPGLELLAYDTKLPESWGERVQEHVNDDESAYKSALFIDFWDGLSSVEGYRAIRLSDATFYKTPHLGNWDSAFQYHYNSQYSYLSRRLSNWEYASSRLYISPFSWIDEGPCTCPYDDAQSVEHVATQLQAFRRWGMGGEFANYVAEGLDSFDYGPYLSALQGATQPGDADVETPKLTLSATSSSPDALSLTGTATDNLAVRAVRWRTDQGHSGAAQMRWKVRSGDHRYGYDWHMEWSAPAIPLNLQTHSVTVTVEDIKGLKSTRTVALDGRLNPRDQEAGVTERGRQADGKPASSRVRARRALRRCLARASARRPRMRRAARRTCRKRHRLQLRRAAL
jgi:hypothetical protein